MKDSIFLHSVDLSLGDGPLDGKESGAWSTLNDDAAVLSFLIEVRLGAGRSAHSDD